MVKRETLVNAVLMFLIIGLGVLVATSRYEAPESPEDLIKAATNDASNGEDEQIDPGTETAYTPPAEPKIFPKLGERQIFRTIISKPTPVPRPTKTPKPDPKISVLLRHWKLNGVIGDQALITDLSKKQEFNLKVGEETTINYRGEDYPIKLSEIDQTQWTATFTFKDQSHTLKPF
jgi:hypothetical protein